MATEDMLQQAWKTAWEKLRNHIGAAVKYASPIGGPYEFGVIDDIDSKWVYVLYADGVHKTHPVNVALDTSAKKKEAVDDRLAV